MDYILNGAAHGNVARRILQAGGDLGVLRPYIGKDGRSYVTVNQNGKKKKLLTNAPATLLKDQWELLDTVLLKVARARLRAWGDLMSGGLSVTLQNGLAKTVFQYQDMSDLSPATMSMDALASSNRDRPHFGLVNLPLPITHKEFSFSLREVLTSQVAANTMNSSGMSIDTTSGEVAAIKVAEEVEKILLGVSPTYSFGGGTIYGYTNFPFRDTKSMTTPTGSNSYQTLADVLDMKKKSQEMFHYGPWMLYNSVSWDQFLDGDYMSASGVASTETLRSRLSKIEGIQGIRTLDYLPAKTMVLVEMRPEVVRAIEGMSMTTIDWESKGGLELNFMVMMIGVPQLRADQNGNTGIVHGTHA